MATHKEATNGCKVSLFVSFVGLGLVLLLCFDVFCFVLSLCFFVSFFLSFFLSVFLSFFLSLEDLVLDTLSIYTIRLLAADMVDKVRSWGGLLRNGVFSPCLLL